ncbi:hypothetical protein DFH11DRAFT_1790712 [Phellopilus nigrolimitatus]|nr:hypothetical protein DFH11DRAFT_1790712 [Phellopilus nigrolimitatus]
MPFDVSNVPVDVWQEIAQLLDTKELVSLQLTCKFLYFDSARFFWLLHLHALDQAKAPNLPRHISVSDLTVPQLHSLVIHAHQRHFNCTSPAPLQPTREITVPICTPPETCLFRPGVELLPGCELFLVCWPTIFPPEFNPCIVVDSSGFELGPEVELDMSDPRFQPSSLQCFNVPGGECIWTHKSSGLEILHFDYDMQANGDVHVVTAISGYDCVAERWTTSLEITQLSPHTKPARQLYTVNVNNGNDDIEFVKLCGDVFAVYTKKLLLLMFWKENRSVMICQSEFTRIDLGNDYLICTEDGTYDGSEPDFDGRSVVAILLSSVHDILPPAPGTTKNLTLKDIPHARCLVPFSPSIHILNNDYKTSVCTFHWKSEAERKSKGINFTVSQTVGDRRTGQLLLQMDYFLLHTPLLDEGFPHLTHLRSLQSELSSTESNSYHGFSTPPSQAGSTLIFNLYPSIDPFTWAFTTISDENEPVLHKFMSNSLHVGIEFYSGAHYFLTEGSKSLIIQYFD